MAINAAKYAIGSVPRPPNWSGYRIVPDQIEFACRNYRPLSTHTTGIVDRLIGKYRKEDEKMATTIEELNRKLMKEAMEMASVKDRLKGLTTEEIEAYLRALKKKKPKRK